MSNRELIRSKSFRLYPQRLSGPVGFPTSRLEMSAVADIFDRDGDGYIDYYEFVAALHPNKDAYKPLTDADKIEDEVNVISLLSGTSYTITGNFTDVDTCSRFLIYDFMCLGDSPSCKVQVSETVPSRADRRQQISGKTEIFHAFWMSQEKDSVWNTRPIQMQKPGHWFSFFFPQAFQNKNSKINDWL